MIFTVCIIVGGNLLSSFVFQNHQEADQWVNVELPNLEKKYGKLTVKRTSLPGLQVGDMCNVWGEADDQFRIVKLIEYSPDRYGFVLDSGWTEEVAKCHTEFL